MLRVFGLLAFGVSAAVLVVSPGCGGPREATPTPMKARSLEVHWSPTPHVVLAPTESKALVVRLPKPVKTTSLAEPLVTITPEALHIVSLRYRGHPAGKLTDEIVVEFEADKVPVGRYEARVKTALHPLVGLATEIDITKTFVVAKPDGKALELHSVRPSERQRALELALKVRSKEARENGPLIAPNGRVALTWSKPLASIAWRFETADVPTERGTKDLSAASSIAEAEVPLPKSAGLGQDWDLRILKDPVDEALPTQAEDGTLLESDVRRRVRSSWIRVDANVYPAEPTQPTSPLLVDFKAREGVRVLASLHRKADLVPLMSLDLSWEQQPAERRFPVDMGAPLDSSSAPSAAERGRKGTALVPREALPEGEYVVAVRAYQGESETPGSVPSVVEKKNGVTSGCQNQIAERRRRLRHVQGYYS